MEKTITIKFTLTPQEIAKLFCDMDMDDQATFFNEIDNIVTTEWLAPFCFQLESITNSSILTNNGRKIMKEIGEYSSEYKKEI